MQRRNAFLLTNEQFVAHRKTEPARRGKNRLEFRLVEVREKREKIGSVRHKIFARNAIFSTFWLVQ